MLFIFLQSFVIGLSIAMPIGPIATLCIKKSLDRGWKFGFAIGLGAALSEGFYGFVAAGGLVFVSQFASQYLFEIKLIGSSALMLIGLAELRNFHKSENKEIKMKRRSFVKTAAFSCALSLTSPMTIIFFVGVFATIGGTTLTSASAAVTVLGVFCGSLFWSTIFSAAIAKMRHKISQKWTARLKLISGLMIFGFGFYAFFGLF